MSVFVSRGRQLRRAGRPDRLVPVGVAGAGRLGSARPRRSHQPLADHGHRVRRPAGRDRGNRLAGGVLPAPRQRWQAPTGPPSWSADARRVQALGDDPARPSVRALAGCRDRRLADQPDLLMHTILGGMWLVNYLPTRTFELAVHGLDIARAVGRPADLGSGVLSASASHWPADSRCNRAGRRRCCWRSPGAAGSTTGLLGRLRSNCRAMAGRKRANRLTYSAAKVRGLSERAPAGIMDADFVV